MVLVGFALMHHVTSEMVRLTAPCAAAAATLDVIVSIVHAIQQHLIASVAAAVALAIYLIACVAQIVRVVTVPIPVVVVVVLVARFPHRCLSL